MTRKGINQGQRGRPLKLHSIIDRDDEGTPVTAGQKIIQLIRSVWLPWEDAAASAGVSSRTIREWRREGATARERIANWKWPDKPITKNERDLAAWITELEQAEATVHAAHLGVVNKAAQSRTKTKTVRTIVGNVEKSKVETTETILPDFKASVFLLQSRRPDLYRHRYEITGADGGPLLSPAERSDHLGALLEAYLQGEQDGAARATEKAEVSSTE